MWRSLPIFPPTIWTIITPWREYTAAKINIFRYQELGDRAIFNYDNDITRALSKQAPAAVMLFSRKQSLEEGVYLRDGAIWLTNEIGSREVLP